MRNESTGFLSHRQVQNMDDKYPFYKHLYLIHGVLKLRSMKYNWFNACTFICQWDTQRPIEMAYSKYLLNRGSLCRQENFQTQIKVVAYRETYKWMQKAIKRSLGQQEKLYLLQSNWGQNKPKWKKKERFFDSEINITKHLNRTIPGIPKVFFYAQLML